MYASYYTRAVYASAYPRGHRSSTLTHTAGDDGLPLCGKVLASSLINDPCAQDPTEPPTCKTCAKRDPRFSQPTL